MKFLHLGDLHIGKCVNDFNMLDDQEYILDQILKMIREYEVDGLLIAGDIYDKAEPSGEAVNVLDHFICELAKMDVSVYIISGNHDSDDRLNFGSALFEDHGIYIYSKFDGTLHKKVLESSDSVEERVNVYMLPFVKASQVRRFYPEAEIKSYEDAVRVIIEHTGIDPKEKNLLIAHQFVAGRDGIVTFGESENLAVQNVGTIEKIGYDIFDAFDYVALGHIHSPQKIGREEVRYCGSPLAYSLKEARHSKSVPLIEFKEGKEVSIELLALKPRRRMRLLKGPLKKLIDPENVTDPQDYIFVTLTDEDMIPNALNIIREYYPNVMKLDYDNEHSKEITQVDFGNITKGKTFEELIAEFYQTMYGCEISEEEMKIMKAVAKEAEVAYEAD